MCNVHCMFTTFDCMSLCVYCVDSASGISARTESDGYCLAGTSVLIYVRPVFLHKCYTVYFF